MRSIVPSCTFAMSKKILFVTTSADRKGEVDQPTGVWYGSFTLTLNSTPHVGLRYEEIAAPYNHFVDKGFDVVLSSVKGGEIPIDPTSLAEGFKTADVERFLQNGAFVRQTHQPNVALQKRLSLR